MTAFDPELFAEGEYENAKSEAIYEFNRKQRKAIRVAEKLGVPIIRTLGLYQPYASLMMCGKIETRWVKAGKKPPFPLGKYLIYSCKKSYSTQEFKKIAGSFYDAAMRRLGISTHTKSEYHLDKNGYALCVGELVAVEKLNNVQMARAYVDFETEVISGMRYVAESNGRILWGLHFGNIQTLDPFPFKGKQGIGFLSEEDKAKIVYKRLE